MRTTLTIEEDVARQIRKRMAEKKLPLKQVVNDALRAGLKKTSKQERVPPFRVEPYPMEFQPGINPDKLNQLVDELEVEDFLRKMSR
jgi:hypothetical protein